MASASSIDNLLEHSLARQIKERALEMGFSLVGFAPAQPSKRKEYLRNWLDQGRAGEMTYLAKRFEERVDPAAYFPRAATVICVAMNYFYPLEKDSSSPHPARVARYALGDDYHELIKDRLFALADWIRQKAPEAQTRCGVDTAPIMEKDLAMRAGIGWIGKNSCLINPRIGSWLLLGEIITTLALPIDEPETDHCGTCRACIDACPTHAITAPYELDATRCISYLTIEHRGPIDPTLQKQMGDWLYGCDVCQDVCPHNTKAVPASDPQFLPRFRSGEMDAEQVLQWDATTYQSTLRRSAMKRVKLPMLQRNAQIVLNNERAAEGEPSK